MIKIEVKFEETGKKPFKGKLDAIISHDLAKAMNDSVMEELIASAHDLRNEMAWSMEKSSATGKRYKRTKDNRYHTASSPYNPPRRDFGNLIVSLIPDVRQDEVEVGSIIEDPPYPFYLEEGTKKMKPRPWADPALEKISPMMENNIAKAIAASTGM